MELAISHDDSDAELVVRARGGDRAAFGELHRRYARAVHGVLLARVAPSVADDLHQDVFLTAWRKLGSLRDPVAFGGWLMALARNRAIDALRRQRPHDELPELAAPPRPVAEANQVLDAIRALPEAYVEPLLLRLVEGMTGPEIAHQLGMTPGSVRVNLHRGMTLLRARLGGPDEG